VAKYQVVCVDVSDPSLQAAQLVGMESRSDNVRRTGYRTLRPDEPATSRVTHTIKLQLFPEERRPGTTAPVAIAPMTELDAQSRTFEHITAAA
jgi:hypothetical protein